MLIKTWKESREKKNYFCYLFQEIFWTANESIWIISGIIAFIFIVSNYDFSKLRWRREISQKWKEKEYSNMERINW